METGNGLLLSDKINFKAENTPRYTNGRFRMIKWSINQEDITNLNIYIPKNRALKYVSQKLIELLRETDKSTIVFRNFNT